MEATTAVEPSFNIEAMSFVFEGDCIQDPTISECGRFEMSPSYYGFDLLPSGTWSLVDESGDTFQLNGEVFTRHAPDGSVIARIRLPEIEFGNS